MRSMTIGRKLLLGFGAVIGLTVLLGVIALVRLSAVAEGVDRIVSNSLPQIYSAAKLTAVSKEQKSAMLSYLASTNASQASSFEAVLAANTGQLEAALKIWEKKNTTASDRMHFAKWTSAHENLMRAWAKIQALSRASRRSQSMDLWIGEALPAAVERAKVLTEMVDASKASGDAEAGLATKAAATGRMWILTVLFLAVSVGFALAIFIMRSTTFDLSQAVDELSRGAEQVTSVAAQISSGSQSLAQGTSEQAASLEETSASSQEMAAMTKKNADSSLEAANLMSIVDHRVLDANATLAEMVISMREITTSSDKISKIIKVIDEIAFQTNILALNAAVEAARAGQAGMGFTVVAEEVRNLAQRSAQAAKDTAALIEESIGRSNEGNTKLGKVEEVIRSITESAQKVKTLIDDVNLSSTEQARGSEQIANSITQMEQVTQQAAASAEQSASAGEQMSSQAKAMLAVIGRLKTMVDGHGLNAETSQLNRPKPVRMALKPVPQLKKIRAVKAMPENFKAVRNVVSPRTWKSSTSAMATTVVERDTFPMDDDFKEF